MRDELDHIDLLNQERWGKCSAEEQARLKQLESTTDFQANKASYNALFNSLDALHLEELEKNIGSWEASYKKKPQNKAKNNGGFRVSRQMRYAAALLLLLSGPLLFYQVFSSPSGNHEQFQNFFQPTIANILRSTSMKNTGAKERNKALNIYSLGDYAQAEKALSSYLTSFSEKDTEIRHFLAVSLLAQGKSQEAKQELILVLQDPLSSYRDEAQWMLILAQLKESNTPEVKRLGQELLQNDGHPRRRQVQELLQKLEKIN